jgi:hypothetical protein
MRLNAGLSTARRLALLPYDAFQSIIHTLFMHNAAGRPKREGRTVQRIGRGVARRSRHIPAAEPVYPLHSMALCLHAPAKCISECVQRVPGPHRDSFLSTVKCLSGSVSVTDGIRVQHGVVCSMVCSMM